MDELDENIDQEMEKPAADPTPPAKKFAPKRVKPIVEGINSGKSTSDVIFVKPTLTEQEKNLIAPDKGENEEIELKLEQEDTGRLLPESVTNRVGKKRHRVKGVIWTGIILALLVFGAYEAYVWHVNQGVLPIPINDFPQNPANGSLQSTSSADDALQFSSTTDSTAGLEATSTSGNGNMTASSTFPLAGGAVSTSTPVIPTPTPSLTHALTITSTPTGYLNVRNGPSTTDNQITQVHPGETYPYTATQNGWYQITLPNGTTGWVSGQYVKVQ